jgi:hypothetical protein
VRATDRPRAARAVNAGGVARLNGLVKAPTRSKHLVIARVVGLLALSHPSASWMAVGAMEPQFYGELCRRLGVDAADVPQGDSPEAWAAHAEVMAARFREKTRAEWEAELAFGQPDGVRPLPAGGFFALMLAGLGIAGSIRITRYRYTLSGLGDDLRYDSNALLAELAETASSTSPDTQTGVWRNWVALGRSRAPASQPTPGLGGL